MDDSKEIKFIKEMIIIIKNNTGNHIGSYEGYCDEWVEDEDCEGCFWHNKAKKLFGNNFGKLEN